MRAACDEPLSDELKNDDERFACGGGAGSRGDCASHVGRQCYEELMEGGQERVCSGKERTAI